MIQVDFSIKSDRKRLKDDKPRRVLYAKDHFYCLHPVPIASKVDKRYIWDRVACDSTMLQIRPAQSKQV